MAEHSMQEESTKDVSSLLNDLNKIGIVLDSGDDIVLLIQSYEKKLQELRKDINTFRESTAKKEEELVSWMTKHIEDRQTISKLEDQLRVQTNKEEEHIYESIRSNNLDRKSQLYDTIGILENEKSELKIENDSLNRKVIDLQCELKNQNGDIGLHKQINRLKEENQTLSKQLESLNSELAEFKGKNDKLQELLSSPDNEEIEKYRLSKEWEKEDAKAKKLESELISMRTDNFNLKTSNCELKEEIIFLKTKLGETDVIVKQRELEYGFALEQVSALKKEKTNLMEELEEKVKEIHDVKEKFAGSREIMNKIESLQSEIKYLHAQLAKDKEAFQLELDVVRGQRERSKVELTSLRKELDRKSSMIVEREMEIRDLREKKTSLEESNNESVYATRDNALRVTLRKVDVNGVKQFGVFLVSRPSRVLITDALEAQQKFVKAGDFVLSINGVNVQNATNESVWSLINEDPMNLVLLRPMASEQEYEIRNQEKGLKLEQSFKVSRLSRTASHAGIRIGDEVIKIDGHDVQSLSAHKIEKKLSSSSVKLYIRRAEEVVHSNANASSTSGGSGHTYETINDTNQSPKSEKSSRLDWKSRSRVSLTSSHSSASCSTNPTGGQAEHPRKESLDFDLRRTSTFQGYQSLKEMTTEEDIVVTSEGPVIRDYDTEGSGDSQVARELPKRRHAREERTVLPQEDGYVDMNSGEQQYLTPAALRGETLSRISESSLSVANGGTSRGTSEYEQERQSIRSWQSPTLPHRPQQALPVIPGRADGAEYQYVKHERLYGKQGQLLDISLKKTSTESSFGFTMFGGNCVGIFVDNVESSSPAGREEVPKGARIISINGHDFVDVAFCFAAEILKGLAAATTLKMKVILTPADQLAKFRLQRPYDSFTIRALVDAPKMAGCTLPFKENDVLTVTDTYENYEPESGGYLWHAMKTMEGGVIREGAIPAEQSIALPFSDDYPEAFEVYGAMKVKEKPGILKALRRKPSSDKIKGLIVFPHGYLYEYMDESIRI